MENPNPLSVCNFFSRRWRVRRSGLSLSITFLLTVHGMRILTIIGTRPEALKMGPILKILAATPGVRSHLCVTGQHRDLIRVPLALFDAHIDTDLKLMRPHQQPDDLLGRLLPRLGHVIRATQPDWILAAGDTTSVLGASLSAAYHRVKFGHVEAGLRTSSRNEPFPEEINRRLTSVVADLHFAPTASARGNLLREGISPESVRVTGNPIIDTVRLLGQQPEPNHPTWWRLMKRLALPPLQSGEPPRLIVVTVHRRENFGEPLSEICRALRELAAGYAGRVKLLCLVHPHPAVRVVLRKNLRGTPHVLLSKPLDYPVMLAILRRAALVLTDSGGLQEEAPALGVPVLVLRQHTERTEGIAAGAARLIGHSRAEIVRATRQSLEQPAAPGTGRRGFSGYGDGQAASRIVSTLLAYPHPAGIPDFCDAA